MAFYPYLTWIDEPASGEPVAGYVLNFATDAEAVFQPFGEYHYQTLEARYVVIDNTANQSAISVQIGAVFATVDQYARRSLYIKPNSSYVKLIGSQGTVNVTFYRVERDQNLLGANDYAIQAAVAAATAALVGQTVGPIINPSFDVWPQGVGPFTSASMIYGPEGHMGTRGGGPGNVSLSRVAGLAGSDYALKVQRPAADANLTPYYYGTQVQSSDAKQFAGKTVTISYNLRAGANYSPAAAILQMAVIAGTGNDQNMFTGFTGATVIATANHTLTAGTQRFTIQAQIPIGATQFGLQGIATPTGVAGADDSFTIEQIQIDVGGSAASFRPVPVALELARCKYFFERLWQETPAIVHGWMTNTNGPNSGHSGMPFLPKRIIPAITVSAAGDFSVYNPGMIGVNACTVLVAAEISRNAAAMIFNIAAAPFFVGGCSRIVATNPGVSFIDVNARM